MVIEFVVERYHLRYPLLASLYNLQPPVVVYALLIIASQVLVILLGRYQSSTVKSPEPNWISFDALSVVSKFPEALLSI